MKKIIYVFLFTFLGILVQFLIHALVEVWYIGLLLEDFPSYGLGFSWENWLMIHNVGAIILFLGGRENIGGRGFMDLTLLIRIDTFEAKFFGSEYAG